MIDRQQLAEELKLRKQIRKAIQIVKERKKTAAHVALQEEDELRNIIRRLINEAEVGDEVPEHSTGINFLKELLTKILPKLENSRREARHPSRSPLISSQIDQLHCRGSPRGHQC